MTYSKQTWINGALGNTPMNALRLGHIEDGIEGASTDLADHVADFDPHGLGPIFNTMFSTILLSQYTKTSNYTLTLDDVGNLVEMNVASANTVTVPPFVSVAFDVGTQIPIRQYGTGKTTITAGAGVTLRSRGNQLVLAGQYAEALVTNRATNEWLVTGDVAAT